MITYSDVKYDCDSGSIHRPLLLKQPLKRGEKKKKKESDRILAEKWDYIH